jgi:TrmH family RNA methyltransferase
MDDADPITSTHNPRVASAAALARSRERRARGLHLAEGPHVVAEALGVGRVEELFVLDGLDLAATLDHGAVGALGRTSVRRVAEHVLARVATTVTPAGLVAVVRTPDLDAPLPARGPLLVLDGVADPGNTGTLVRVADAAGCAGVVIVGDGADPFSPKAVRSSAGSCYHLPVLVRRDADALVAEAHATGREVHGLAAGSGRDVFGAGLPVDVALVVGSEAHGLSEAMTAAHQWLDANQPGVSSCVIEPGNRSSVRVAEKLGYRKSGETLLGGVPVGTYRRGA